MYIANTQVLFLFVWHALPGVRTHSSMLAKFWLHIHTGNLAAGSHFFCCFKNILYVRVPCLYGACGWWVGTIKQWSLGASGENLWVPWDRKFPKKSGATKILTKQQSMCSQDKRRMGVDKEKQNTSPWCREAGAPNSNNNHFFCYL